MASLCTRTHLNLLGFDHVTMSICGLSSFPAPADLLFLSSPGLNCSTLTKQKCKKEEKQKAELSYFTFFAYGSMNVLRLNENSRLGQVVNDEWEQLC